MSCGNLKVIRRPLIQRALVRHTLARRACIELLAHLPRNDGRIISHGKIATARRNIPCGTLRKIDKSRLFKTIANGVCRMEH